MASQSELLSECAHNIETEYSNQLRLTQCCPLIIKFSYCCCVDGVLTGLSVVWLFLRSGQGARYAFAGIQALRQWYANYT